MAEVVPLRSCFSAVDGELLRLSAMMPAFNTSKSTAVTRSAKALTDARSFKSSSSTSMS